MLLNYALLTKMQDEAFVGDRRSADCWSDPFYQKKYIGLDV